MKRTASTFCLIHCQISRKYTYLLTIGQAVGQYIGNIANALSFHMTDRNLDETEMLDTIVKAAGLETKLLTIGDRIGWLIRHVYARLATHRPWTRVPGSWQPNEEHKRIARDYGRDFEHELAMFRDYEFRVARTDADAAFRVWLRNSQGGAAPGLRSHMAQKAEQQAYLPARVQHVKDPLPPAELAGLIDEFLKKKG